MGKKQGLAVYHDELGDGEAAKLECQAWLAALHKHCELNNQDGFFALLRGSSGKSGDKTVNRRPACSGCRHWSTWAGLKALPSPTQWPGTAAAD
jgi:hypothetical protein